MGRLMVIATALSILMACAPKISGVSIIDKSKSDAKMSTATESPEFPMTFEQYQLHYMETVKATDTDLPALLVRSMKLDEMLKRNFLDHYGDLSLDFRIQLLTVLIESYDSSPSPKNHQAFLEKTQKLQPEDNQ